MVAQVAAQVVGQTALVFLAELQHQVKVTMAVGQRQQVVVVVQVAAVVQVQLAQLATAQLTMMVLVDQELLLQDIGSVR